MYKRLFLISFFLIFLVFNFISLFAYNSTSYNFNYIQNNLEHVKDTYNSNIEKVPNFVKDIFGNENILVNIIKLDGTQKFISIKTKKGLVTKLDSQTEKKYTLKVKVSEKKINEILSSEDIILNFKKALKTKEITLKALTLKTYIKINILKTLLYFI